MSVELIIPEGIHLLQPSVFKDNRGYFFESFNEKKFNSITQLDIDFVQDNQSLSSKNVLRGLHFQLPPFAQAKLVRVVRGAVLDVAVDLRKNSPTFGKYYSVGLNEENNLSLFIPVGFAHGFVALKENTLFLYKCSEYYNKESEQTILWNDPDLNIDWKCTNPLISEKDKEGILFKDFKSPF